VVKTRPTELKQAAARETNKLRLFLFGVNRGRLFQVAQEMQLDVNIVENLREATTFITSKNYYRRREQKIREAEAVHLSVYVLRSNTPPQMRQMLSSLYHLREEVPPGEFKTAIDEAENAVTQVKEAGEPVDLTPQTSYIRRLQHLVAQRSDLASHSFGKEPNRRVKIFKERAG
jgi:hypothetical protein